MKASKSAKKLTTMRDIGSHDGAPVLTYFEWRERLNRFADKSVINSDLETLAHRQSYWLLEYEKKRVYRNSKRIFDFTAALVALILLAPIFVVCAILVKLSSPGPVFFFQLRMGLLGKPFWIWKFRTMAENARFDQLKMSDGKVVPLKKVDLATLTPIGRILRRTKLDETPQLINVLRGEMSLVGPRPLPIDESLTTPTRFESRFAALPGLSGLWQVTLSYNAKGLRKIARDAIYVRRRSWKMDLWILVKTVRVLIKGE